ncbi:MAG TPA: YceI family protein [Burkholderiales bacterium]|nr:YceI family protein [Burkholderiales bacterium]
MSRLAICIVAAGLAAPVSAAPESFTIDPYHTFPYFTVNHLGYTNFIGRFDKTTGKISLDAAAKSGTVELVVETASLTTGDNDRGTRPRTRDEHLRSPDFFNVAEFPRMTFKGKTARWTGEMPGAIEGEVTLLGVTKPLNLTVESFKCGPDPRTQGKRYMCGGNAAGTIKRSDFGMKFGVGPVSDEIKLYIAIEAFRD